MKGKPVTPTLLLRKLGLGERRAMRERNDALRIGNADAGVEHRSPAMTFRVSARHGD